MTATQFNGTVIEDRTLALLDAEKVDGLIATSRVSLRHLAGLHLPHLKIVPEERVFFLFAGPGTARTLLPDWQVPFGNLMGAPNVYQWAWDVSPWVAVAKHAEEMGIANGRIGVELDYLTANDVSELSKALPNATLVGVDDALLGNRRIKTEGELVHIRAAAEAGERAVARVISEGRIGMTDRQLARLLHEAAIDEGADDLVWVALRWGNSEQRTYMMDRPIAADEVVSIEFGVGVDAYYADMQRTFIVQPSNSIVADQYERLARVHSTTISRMRPGRAISEFTNEFLDEMRAAGLEMWDWWLGHSLGLEVHEGGRIWLSPEEHSTIDPGMVFAVEPCVDGEVFLALEDDVEITSAGAVNLSGGQFDWSTLPILGESLR